MGLLSEPYPPIVVDGDFVYYGTEMDVVEDALKQKGLEGMRLDQHADCDDAHKHGHIHLWHHIRWVVVGMTFNIMCLHWEHLIYNATLGHILGHQG